MAQELGSGADPGLRVAIRQNLPLGVHDGWSKMTLLRGERKPEEES